MNIQQRPRHPVMPGADGFKRHAFTADDVRRMTEIGILGADQRVELVNGELIEMSPKGHSHDWVKDSLVRDLFDALGRDIRVSVEGTIQLAPFTLVDPDVLVFRAGAASASSEGYKVVPGSDILLAVEIAVTSLAYDRRRKAALYASHDIPEYWVLDLKKPRTFVHRQPRQGRYATVSEVSFRETLTALAPELAAFRMKLADLLA